MFKKILMLLLFILLTNLYAQLDDSLKTYMLLPVEVRAKVTTLTQRFLPAGKDNLGSLLKTNGFKLIRKGTFFAQDVYGDGFKRNDIEVTIDGERYHSACPNRMDSPLTRVNPIELQEIEMNKSSTGLQCGLGGKINFIRSKASDEVKLKSAVSAIAGNSQGIDAAVSLQSSKQRLSLRYSSGKPYTDADSRDFMELYNYKDNFRYTLAEALFTGSHKSFDYGLGFTYTDNVSFPYLQMDEKFNKVYNAHLSYKNNKLYFNYTSHMMNNSLRVSNMSMVTDAQNLTVGLIGANYEVYYRNWNADNEIITPMMSLTNNLMPEVSQVSATANYSLNLSGFILNAKGGLVYNRMGEKDLTLYKQIDNEAKDYSLFPLIGFSAGIRESVADNLTGTLMLEASTDAPSLESQFIAVKKPMGKPTWLGNTNLELPVKAGVRANIIYSPFFIELYAVRLWNYVELMKKEIDNTNYQTFGNIDAYMFGFNIDAEYGPVNISANYTYAENTTKESPLSEIAPLVIKTMLTSPEYYGISVYARHTYNDAQTRIDILLGETSTPQWNKFDLGITYKWNRLTFSLEAENITNELYYQHLSFLRNPFASGARVMEAGRIFRFNVFLDQLF